MWCQAVREVPGGEDHDAGLVGDGAVVADRVGEAVPGFEAEQVNAGAGPDAELGEAAPGEFDGFGARGAVAQGGAGDGVEDDGVFGEQAIMQGEDVAGDGGGEGFGAEQAVRPDAADGGGFLGGEGEAVGLLGDAGAQRPVEGRVGAHRGREGFGAGVLQGEGDGEAVGGDGVGDFEAEGEGVDGAGGGAVDEDEAGGGGAALHPFEQRVAGEAVAEQFVGLAVVAIMVVAHGADDGEQVGGVLWPGGMGLPQEFGAGLGDEGAQFGALGLDAGSCARGADAMVRHGFPFGDRPEPGV